MAKTYAPTRRRSPHRRGSWTKRMDLSRTARAIGLVVALLAMFGGIAAWTAHDAQIAYADERDEHLCLLHAAAPQKDLLLLDETDPLAKDSGKRFENIMQDVTSNLPRNARLTVVPFGGDLGQAPVSIFDFCSPGRGAEAKQWSEGKIQVQATYNQQFGAPLAQAQNTIRDSHSSNASPIVEQIERVMGDPSIAFRGDHRTLIVMTDGLQNTATSLVYADGHVTLPPAPAGLLKGVDVHYVELASEAHPELQQPSVRSAWLAWFRAAGARSVRMSAPGYSGEAES